MSAQNFTGTWVFLFSVLNEWWGVSEWQIELIQICILTEVPIPRLFNPDEPFWTKKKEDKGLLATWYMGPQNPRLQLAVYFRAIKFQEIQIYFWHLFWISQYVEVGLHRRELDGIILNFFPGDQKYLK